MTQFSVDTVQASTIASNLMADQDDIQTAITKLLADAEQLMVTFVGQGAMSFEATQSQVNAAIATMNQGLGTMIENLLSNANSYEVNDQDAADYFRS
jgi:WXG100 family type VII secretion target